MALTRQPFRRYVRRRRCDLTTCGNHEIREVAVPLLVEKDVGGFEITMDDPLAVGAASALPTCSSSREAGSRFHGPRSSACRERAAPQPAHDEVGTLGVAPVVVQRDRVWMLELRYQLGLGLEAADERRVVDQLGTDDLDRDLPPDRRLVRAIDDAEVTAADLLAQLVAANRAAERAERG